jgi:hypothetical protein
MEVSGKKIYSHPWVIIHPGIDQGLEDVPEKSDSAERGQDRQRTEEWLDELPGFNDCLQNVTPWAGNALEQDQQRAIIQTVT